MIRRVLLVSLAAMTLLACSASQTTQAGGATESASADSTIVTVYEVDKGLFPNPERGFYRYTNLAELDPSIGTIRDEELITLVWGRIMMESYRDQEQLPQEFLGSVERGFQTARDQGMKVIVRGSYGFRGSGGDYTTYEDPPVQNMRHHIEQLAPIFAAHAHAHAHADVIALFEAGFIGPWGEWHSTQLANDMDQSRTFLHHILDHTPRQSMVLVRYPLLKQQIFATGSGFEQVTAANAYSGEPVARVGHHNDCLLSSADDVGTYDRGGMDRAGEVAYLAEETLHTVFGGETCADYELNDCAPALGELATLHTSYLNSGWHPDVMKKWERDGCLEEVQRRLGAHLVLHESRIPAQGRAGDGLHITLVLENEGFASLYNARDVNIVLHNPTTGGRWTISTGLDPRAWKPSERQDLEVVIQLPADIPPGTYSLHLHLADPSPALRGDARYAYRMASEGVWDEVTGWNKLVDEFTIDTVP